MTSRYSLSLLLLLAHTCLAYNGHGWWLRQPYEKDEDFNSDYEYGETYTLKIESNMTVNFWVLPDMQILGNNNVLRVEYLSIDGTSATEWMGNGESLNISIVLEDQFGFYFCHGLDESGRNVVEKKAVNYQGSYFGDTWETYRLNTIIGCSSAAIFFVIACVSYLFLDWNSGDDDEDQTAEEDMAKNNTNQAEFANVYPNNGYEEDVVKNQPAAMIDDDTTAL